MNPFKQQIGIYYKDRRWADYIKQHLREDLFSDGDNIVVYIKDDTIELYDGTTIRFVYATDAPRGYRFTKSFIQHGIDKDIYECMIAPRTLPNQCYVINDYEGLFYYGTHYIASKYYQTINNSQESFVKEYEYMWEGI